MSPVPKSVSEIARVPMQIMSGCIVASIPVDLTTELLRAFQQDLLSRIKSSGVSAVILDVSGVDIMDLRDFEMLRRSMVMASIMGARPILVGLGAGIVSSLITLDANVEGFEAAADLDTALQIVRSSGKDSESPAGDQAGSASALPGNAENSIENRTSSYTDSQ